MPTAAPRPPKLPVKVLTAAERSDGYAQGRELHRRAALAAGTWPSIVAGAPTEADRRLALAEIETAARARVKAITDRLLAGEINRTLWQKQMRAVLIPHHYAAALAGRGETGAALDPSARKAIEAGLRKQFGYLDRFRADLGFRKWGPWVASRAGLYAGATWATGQEARREQAKGQGLGEERAVLSAAASCATCLDRAAQGWQPIGTLRPIGDGECKSNCKCSFIYKGKTSSARVSATLRGQAAPAFAPRRSTESPEYRALVNRGEEREARAGNVPNTARTAPQAAVATPAVAPAGTATPKAPRSRATPILPGRPIAERLAADTGSAQAVEQIAALGQQVDRASQKLLEARTQARRIALESDTLFKQTDGAIPPEDRARLSAAYKAAAAEAAIHEATIRDAIAGQRAEVVRLLAADRPQRWSYMGAGTEHAVIGPKVKEAEGFLGPILARRVDDNPAVVYDHLKTKNGRAYFDEKKRQIKVIPENEVATLIHERGHHLEEVFPEIGKLSREFLAYRVGDEKSTRLKDVQADYRADEFGRKDKFDAHFPGVLAYYVGKPYSKATEILSMGLEALHRDPVGFARDDPEYCRFVVGILTGAL